MHLKLELEEYAKMSAEDNRDVTVLQWEAIEHGGSGSPSCDGYKGWMITDWIGRRQ